MKFQKIKNKLNRIFFKMKFNLPKFNNNQIQLINLNKHYKIWTKNFLFWTNNLSMLTIYIYNIRDFGKNKKNHIFLKLYNKLIKLQKQIYFPKILKISKNLNKIFKIITPQDSRKEKSLIICRIIIFLISVF